MFGLSLDLMMGLGLGIFIGLFAGNPSFRAGVMKLLDNLQSKKKPPPRNTRRGR